ncbi:hypothetical protein L6452_14661 [Arctium lappa]|uniref:Uncharacterized protein n=1 Tax=Arctium lappa TaxID=4217 RepID=A0ACB9CLN2_ARCLA|nr:hypothetical protein L6452_14661 [Arctium lappa]
MISSYKTMANFTKLRFQQIHFLSNRFDPKFPASSALKNGEPKKPSPSIDEFIDDLEEDEAFSYKVTPDRAMIWVQGFLEKLIRRPPLVWRYSSEKGFDALLVFRCAATRLIPMVDDQTATKTIFLPSHVKKEDVKVTMDGTRVVVKARDEIIYKFNLPRHINRRGSKIRAKVIRDHVLEIYLPRPRGNEDVEVEY